MKDALQRMQPRSWVLRFVQIRVRPSRANRESAEVVERNSSGTVMENVLKKYMTDEELSQLR